ncbi:MAG: CDP-alcohol phosphatidyltransferase family protein [Candidatus Ventricola sp.]
MANFVTSIRLVCAAALILLPAFSPAFYALYLLAGLSDMTDGFIARRTNSVSSFGAKLDTLADLAFAAVCLLKLLPLLDFPRWLLAWVLLIAVIKLVNVISGFVLHKRFVPEHTRMNKLTGLLLFALPLALPVVRLSICGGIVCAAATWAAIEEGHLIRTGRVIE